MYDFGIEEKEFQLMLDVATEKMEMNEVTFGLISDTMRRVRDSGKLDDYTRTQVGLLCNDFSVAIEKLNNKTEYEVAMEEMSGGMMALVAAGVLLVSTIIAKILGFFTGSSSSSSSGGGGGSDSSSQKISKLEENKVVTDKIKDNFTKLNPGLDYLCPMLERIEKEIGKMSSETIELFKTEHIKASLKKIRDNKANIFALLSDSDCENIKNQCTNNGGYIFTKDYFHKRPPISEISRKLEKLTSVINDYKSITERASPKVFQKEMDIFRERIKSTGDNKEAAREAAIKAIDTLKLFIELQQESVLSIGKMSAEIDANEATERVLGRSDPGNVVYDDGLEFMDNIIFKRDEYPNIFNTFSTSGLGEGSEFIKKLIGAVIDIVEIEKDIDRFKEEEKKDVSSDKGLIAWITVEVTNIGLPDEANEIYKYMHLYYKQLSSFLVTFATFLRKSMRVFDNACNLTKIFFDLFVDISTMIGILNSTINRSKIDVPHELKDLISKYIKDYVELFITDCRRFKKLYYVEGSQLANSSIAKLVNHISRFGN